MLQVSLACETCDLAALRSALPFVVFGAADAPADVTVTVTRETAGAGERWTAAFAGRGTFNGLNRTLAWEVATSATPEEARAELIRHLKLGLAEYAVRTASGKYLEVTHKRKDAGAPGAKPAQQKDPWNYWVFRMSANGNASGESSQSDNSYYLSASANRVTEEWKVRFSGSRSVRSSRFEIDDTTTITSRFGDWNIDSLIVKSLGPKWSFGLTSSLVGSTFSNSELVARITPGIEYDIFPYAESSRRSLTLQYAVGGAHYDYEAETIFGKFKENIATHQFQTSLGLRQRWGSAGGSFTFLQHLTAFERTRLTMSGNVSVRLLRSLSFNTFASYSRIRDQFTLEKGEATDDEVLLRQRALSTGFRYSFNFGISYSFGALSNTTVNPRFGG